MADKQAGASTVTFTRASDGITTRVKDPESGLAFRKGYPIENVDDATVARLQTLEGFKFDVSKTKKGD